MGSRIAARLALGMCMTAAAAFAQAGDWIAALDFEPVKLRLALHLAPLPDGRLTGRFDSIDQDAFGLPVARLRAGGRRVEFAVPRIGGRFAGELSPDGRLIEGVWKQRGGSIPLRFVRGNLRPQEPAPPYPYLEEEVVLRNGPVRLAGTLTLPRTDGPHPAIVLLTGSGPQDRNDTVSGHRPFLVWADYLTRRGFAVLRMDDRGVGGSTGRLLDATDEDFAADALAGVEALKARADIDRRRIGLLGHSEGGAVAPLAAVRSPDVAFVVLLAAPAIPGERLLYEQEERISRAMGIPEDVARKRREVETKLLGIARKGENAEAARRKMRALVERGTATLSPEEAAVIRGQLGAQVETASSRWFRFVIDYDPRPVLERLRCPVLALYGGLDLQVPADLNAPAMEQALAGKPKHTVITMPGLNHLMQTARTGSPVEYAQIEETVAPEVLERVGDWMKGVEGDRRPEAQGGRAVDRF